MLSGRPHSLDAVLGGRIELEQPRSGYRVNVDSLLLVAFAGTRRVQRLVDLGAGVGVLALLALERGLAQSALLVERDAELAELAARNLERSGLAGEVLVLDLEQQRVRESGVPLVLCNPPYYDSARHRPAQQARRRAARSGDLQPFVSAAAAILARKSGRALFSYPAPELPALLAAAAACSLVPKRLRFVHARSHTAARLCLIELRAARPGGLVIEAPLVEWDGRKRTPELQAITGSRAVGRR
jgi:tRNA1(Val) A37 N6-methylase TrmN6